MKTIHESPFFMLEFDQEKKLIKSTWLEKNAQMEDEEMKKEIETAASLIEQYKPKLIITDDRARTYIYTVDLQNWVATTLSKACISAGVKKFAVLLPTEIIAQMSTEQAADEVSNRPYEINLFSEEESAIKWIDE